MELTILMPCLNEAKTVAASVAEAKAYLRQSGVEGEVLVSDNGSDDGSQALAVQAGARVVHASVRGYGAALIEGIRQAKGRFVIMGDCDLSYDFSQLDGFMTQLRAGAALVMGNRFDGQIMPGAMPVLHRYLGNPVLSFIGRLFFRTHIGDFHCGLRGFDRAEILKLNLVLPGMEFASEMVVKAALAKLPMTEVPTTLRPDGRDRPPHLRTWHDGWRHLRFLLLFCPRWLFLYPGAVLTLIGLLIGGLVQQGPFQLFGLGLGIHTLLYMGGAVVLGVQMIFLALIIKWVGVLSGVVPAPFWIRAWPRCLGVEAGVLSSMLLFAMGLYGSATEFLFWQQQGFSGLDPAVMMRRTIPAVTLMIIGGQMGTSTLLAAALHSLWMSTGRTSRP